MTIKALVLWVDGECLYARSSEYGDYMLDSIDYPGKKESDIIDVEED